jgi:hypothetical protein
MGHITICSDEDWLCALYSSLLCLHIFWISIYRSLFGQDILYYSLFVNLPQKGTVIFYFALKVSCVHKILDQMKKAAFFQGIGPNPLFAH